MRSVSWSTEEDPVVKNKRSARCCACKGHVRARHGVVSRKRGRWLVKHRTCSHERYAAPVFSHGRRPAELKGHRRQLLRAIMATEDES